MKDRVHSRWSRNQQRLGGTTQMWTLLSFTGRFDAKYLEDTIKKGGAKQPLNMPGERTPEEKKKVREAQEARARLRRGAMLERLQQDNKKLNRQQQEVLRQYRNDQLRQEANRFTMASGHGRLKRKDDSFVDIGGSTGGFVRVVLDDWEKPELSEFQET